MYCQKQWMDMNKCESFINVNRIAKIIYVF